MANERGRFFANQLRFGGAVGASLSHEINNVLAIVGELNGLLEDLYAFRKKDEAIDPTKLKSVTDRIASEIQRGKHFVKQLNTFAHSVDTPEQEMDLAEVLRRVMNLSARLARLRKVTFTTGALMRQPL